MRFRPAALVLASAAFAMLPTTADAQVEQNTSLNGTRLTFYPRPDGNQCIADCVNNAACQGVTWIQAGTYNPGDAAMCYLLSTVSGRAQARGHYSMVKRPAGGVAPVPAPAAPAPRPAAPNDFTPADIGTI